MSTLSTGPRSIFSAAALYGLMLLAPPTGVSGQDNTCRSPTELGLWLEGVKGVTERYAPEFIFSPGEQYLPTMSFFTALDGRNNNDDPRIDFEDPAEIAALKDGRPSWNLLHDQYRALTEPERLQIGAIYYQIRDLPADEISEMWRFLKSDEQAWKRFDIERSGDGSLLMELQRADTEFLVADFHAYYINDLGLIGHNYDTEYVRIFVPKDERLAKQFRIVVGAGHTERVPNNVLVLTGQLAEREWDDEPGALPPGILVELGDHSSAPDILPRGAFSPGYDANWHAHDLWGTRDVQSSSGLGALGQYELWMTYPRDPAVEPLAMRYPVGSVTDGQDAIMKQAAQQRMRIESPADSVTDQEERLGDYRLISARAFDCLFERIDSDPPLDEVQAWLTLAHRDFGDAFRALSPTEQVAAVNAMRRWREGLSVDGKDSLGPAKVLIWDSKHYDSRPSDAFKQHLFRPVFGAMPKFSHVLDLFHIWLTWQPGNAVMVQAGVEIPAWHVALRLPGYMEAQAGIYSSCRNVIDTCGARGESPAFSLLHTWHYNRPITWYQRLTFIPERDQAEGDPLAADWLAGGGLSLAFFGLRARIGLSTDFRWKNGPQLGETFWEIVLSWL